MSVQQYNIDFEPSLGSVHDTLCSGYDEQNRVSLANIHNNKCSSFGYIYENYVGCLLQSMYLDVEKEPLIHIKGKRMTPDFLVVEDDLEFLVEVKSGYSGKNIGSNLSRYSSILPTVCIVHDEHSSLAKKLVHHNNYGAHVTTHDRMHAYEFFQNTTFSKFIQDKADVLRNTSMDELKEMWKHTNLVYDLFQSGISNKDMRFWFESF